MRERLAMVYAARGDRSRAAEYYRKAADFVHVHMPIGTIPRWRSTFGKKLRNSSRRKGESRGPAT